MVIRALLIAALGVLAACRTTSPVDEFDELERIDSSIHDAPEYPGRGNPLIFNKKSELLAWSTPVSYEQKTGIYGAVHFRIEWPEATVTGAFPIRHCCTEVLFGSLVTSNKEWRFFRNIRVGSKEQEVLEALAPDAKKENDKIKYCGLNQCAIFTLHEGHVSEVSLHLYLD